MKCERCGWAGSNPKALQMKLVDWPAHLPPPLPPPTVLRHAQHCPSCFKVGDEVYWDCGDGNLPPIRGTFIRITEFKGPDFELEPDGTWTVKATAVPSTVAICIDKTSVIEDHRFVVGTEIDTVADEFMVDYSDIELASKWPVLTF